MTKSAWLGLLVFGVGAARAQTATAVPALDLKQFSKSWYEIARFPVKTEKKCVRDGLMLFAAGEKQGRMSEVTSCINAKNYAEVRNYGLKLKDKKVMDGRLGVTHLLILHRPQWVLAVGPDYSWALIGNPNHKTLWVLSKTVEMAPDVLAEVKAKAAAEGYDMSKLLMVTQTHQSGRATQTQP